MKRIHLILSLAFTASLVLSACGGEEAPEGEENQESTEETTGGEEAAGMDLEALKSAFPNILLGAPMADETVVEGDPTTITKVHKTGSGDRTYKVIMSIYGEPQVKSVEEHVGEDMDSDAKMVASKKVGDYHGILTKDKETGGMAFDFFATPTVNFQVTMETVEGEFLEGDLRRLLKKLDPMALAELAK